MALRCRNVQWCSVIIISEMETIVDSIESFDLKEITLRSILTESDTQLVLVFILVVDSICYFTDLRNVKSLTFCRDANVGTYTLVSQKNNQIRKDSRHGNRDHKSQELNTEKVSSTVYGCVMILVL